MIVATLWFVAGGFFERTMGEDPQAMAKELDSPAAVELREWLMKRMESAGRESISYESILSLRASLEHPVDGRSRFVMPRSANTTKKSNSYLEKAFPEEEERKEFQGRLGNMLVELSQSIQSFESNGQWESAYRQRWRFAGFSALQVPVRSQPWSPAVGVLQPRRSGGPAKGSHPITQWPASSYQWIQTPHFEIASQANANDTAMIAEWCELSLALWQQMFFSVWANDSNAAPHFDIPQSTPFQVVVFRTKESYIKSLQSQVRNVSISTGYYNQNAKACFFYLDEKKSLATLVHELTHQFFAEGLGSEIAFDPDRTRGFWAAEGIALYMESMSIRDMGSCWLIDIGGWDANRVQAARFRFLRDRFWLTWDGFGTIDGTRFRAMDDIGARYSQACGLAHYWMENSPSDRSQFMLYLQSLYRSGEVKRLEPNDDEQLLQAYGKFLLRGPRETESYLPFASRKDLVLSRSAIDSRWIETQLRGKRMWDWFDLSFTKVDDELWTNETAGTPWDITRLSVESTNITDRSISVFAKMPRLSELDLSNCKITDAGVASLSDSKSLRTLWITDCPISDQSIDALGRFSRLETLQAKGTQITEGGWKKLKLLKPRLKVNLQ